MFYPMNWKCHKCSGFLRCKINNGNMIPMPISTPLGGEFCSSSCAMYFLDEHPNYKPVLFDKKKIQTFDNIKDDGWYIGEQKID